jgi:hypothetical protein
MARFQPWLAVVGGAIALASVLIPASLAAQQPESAAEKQDKKRQGSELLRELGRKRTPILATLAEKHGYRLRAGEVLRRVAPPFPAKRMEYYRVGHPSQAKAIPAGPAGIIFHERAGRLTNWGMTFGGDDGYSLGSLIDGLTGIKGQMIEAGDVLQAHVPGDWVLRIGAKDADIIERLAEILRKELALDVRMEFREIERPVYVVRGTYAFTPLPGGRKQDTTILADRTLTSDPIEIFAKELVPNSGAGGGSGSFDEFLAWLGDWVEKPIVSEIAAPPKGRFSWHLHARSPFTDAQRAEDHDPMLVLPNITAQTGLTFTPEQRPIRTLFVDGTK